ncbi:MAG TPA: twin-arginine translocase subunit TatC [Mycobacteriales bacterium]|jgi:sec-independent protein translocase protein TatC|nr:twin-arginine translocase subunit TatC [Mycobacteriales bacterium]
MPRPARAHRDRSPDGRMTLGEHLSELRYRVVVSLIAVVITTTVAYVFHTDILRFLTHPYCELPERYRAIKGQCTLVVGGVLDPFTVTLKLALYAGVLAASPIWLFQFWRFITPGLYSHEKRYATVFVAASVALFAMGAAFAYLTLEKGLHFLLGFASGGIASLLQFNSYLSFVTAMILVFAVSFELPLLVVMLNLVGVLPAAKLRHWTRGAIFGIFLFAAVATPSQDPFTMSALAVPMCVLYGVAVLIASIHDRRVAARGGLYDDLADDELSPIDDAPAVP